MGFYKDFENEIKAFFILIVLLMMAGWFGAVSSMSFFRAIQPDSPVIQQGQIQQQENGLQEVLAEETETMEQEESAVLVYLNESLGVSFEYPKDWYVYDQETWQEDNTIASCQTQGTIENTVIVSQKNLGRCVGVTQFNAWPGDLLISFAETEWEDFPFVLQGENPGLSEVGGVSVAKYPFSQDSSVNRKQAVRLYANSQSRGYIIEFTQTDVQGNYDPVFDEILGSLQWL